jgi:signal transduction histidine kinase
MPFKKILILFFLSLLLPLKNAKAQTSTNLKEIKATILRNQQDTNTVQALLNYGQIMSNQNADSASTYFQKAFELSKKLNYKNGIAHYYNSFIFLNGNRKGNKKEALLLGKEFIKFALKENNYTYLNRAYFSIASIYQVLDKDDSAIIFYEKSLKILDNTKSNEKKNTIYGSLSRIYSQQKMDNIALEYLNKAIDLNLKNKDTSALIINYINGSTLYYQMKNKTGEEKFNREGLRLAKLSNNSYLQIGLCTNLAAMFEDRQNYDSSIIYNQRAYLFAKKYGSPIKSVYPLIGLVACYVKKNNFNEANNYLKLISENLDIKKISIDQELLITEQKIKVFKGLGKYKEATELFTLYNKLSDSTINIATQERVLEFNNKLKKAESEKVILEKEVKIGHQKTWLYVLSISALALLLSGFLFFRYQNKKQEAKNQKIELLEKENEFIAIKSSLEGQLNERVRISKEIHDDLGSSLTTISLLSEILKTKIDETKIPEVNKISLTSARMVDSMNEIVWALNIQNDTLDSLVAFIRKYARDFLQDTPIKLVFEENVTQDFSLQGNVRRSIYLVVKEAINNVVKHADAQNVKLNIQADNEKLSIIIEDDGKGLNEAKKSIFGNGLKNMKQRMEDIGGSFEINHSNGFKVQIEYSLM